MLDEVEAFIPGKYVLSKSGQLHPKPPFNPFHVLPSIFGQACSWAPTDTCIFLITEVLDHQVRNVDFIRIHNSY